jgi:hypothetical protein
VADFDAGIIQMVIVRSGLLRPTPSKSSASSCVLRSADENTLPWVPKFNVAVPGDEKGHEPSRHHAGRSRQHELRAAARPALPTVKAPPTADIVGGRGQLIKSRSGNDSFWDAASIGQWTTRSLAMSAPGPSEDRALADGFVRSWSWSCRRRQPTAYASMMGIT